MWRQRDYGERRRTEIKSSESDAERLLEKALARIDSQQVQHQRRIWGSMMHDTRDMDWVFLVIGSASGTALPYGISGE
jgi:hypothetical protein